MHTIVAIDHVQIAMPQGGEDKAREFYGKLLGLDEIPKPSALAKRGGNWFEKGNIRIHLGVEQEFTPARKAHLALSVTKLDQLAKALKKSGYTVEYDEAIPHVRRFYTHDPFGNRIELMEAK